MAFGSLCSSLCDNSLNHSHCGLGGDCQYGFFSMTNLDGLYYFYCYAAEMGLDNPYGLYDSYDAMGVGTDFDAIYSACCGLCDDYRIQSYCGPWGDFQYYLFCMRDMEGLHNSYGYAAHPVLHNPYGLYDSYNGIGVDNEYDSLYNPCRLLGGDGLCTSCGSNYHVLDEDRPCNSKSVITVPVEGPPNRSVSISLGSSDTSMGAERIVITTGNTTSEEGKREAVKEEKDTASVDNCQGRRLPQNSDHSNLDDGGNCWEIIEEEKINTVSS
jgi:hypothetical protein